MGMSPPIIMNPLPITATVMARRSAFRSAAAAIITAATSMAAAAVTDTVK